MLPLLVLDPVSARPKLLTAMIYMYSEYKRILQFHFEGCKAPKIAKRLKREDPKASKRGISK